MPEPRANCTITIRGSFNLNWADYVEDMLVHVQVEEGTVRTTTLIGHPIDLEAFLGILHMLIDRGFPVIAFEYRHPDYWSVPLGSASPVVESVPL